MLYASVKNRTLQLLLLYKVVYGFVLATLSPWYLLYLVLMLAFSYYERYLLMSWLIVHIFAIHPWLVRFAYVLDAFNKSTKKARRRKIPLSQLRKR